MAQCLWVSMSLHAVLLLPFRLWHQLTQKLMNFVKHESFASGGLLEVVFLMHVYAHVIVTCT